MASGGKEGGGSLGLMDPSLRTVACTGAAGVLALLMMMALMLMLALMLKYCHIELVLAQNACC